MKRREFIILSGASAIALATGCSDDQSKTPIDDLGRDMMKADVGEDAQRQQDLNEDLSEDGTGEADIADLGIINLNPLPIPVLLKGEQRGGIVNYDLNVQESTHTFFENIAAPTFGINGDILGPTLLLENGKQISINYKNQLAETITMHGHGMHTPALMDGTPHQPIMPGQTWSAEYTVNQRASTCWYHPHTMDETAKQVYKGLAGLIIVEDDESKALDLPKRYGVDDIPLVLQDRRFKDGKLDYSPSRMEIMRGYIGDTLIANGAIDSQFDAEAKEIRFRILNGSNSTVYKLAFSDGRSFKQIATDASFLEQPVELSELTLSPAERAEIVVDFTNDMGEELSLMDLTQNKSFCRIKVSTPALVQTSLPQNLTSLTKLNEADALRTRQFVLAGPMMRLQINGASMDINVINESVKLNEIEIWEIRNNMRVDHNFHIHATHFMLLDRNNQPVPENEKGYKDCVYVPANQSVRFIVKMVDYADPNVPYMYHCHFLEHEDAGMMGQFVVIA